MLRLSKAASRVWNGGGRRLNDEETATDQRTLARFSWSTPCAWCHSLKNGGNFCAVIIMIMLFMFKYVGKGGMCNVCEHMQPRRAGCRLLWRFVSQRPAAEPSHVDIDRRGSKQLIEKLASPSASKCLTGCPLELVSLLGMNAAESIKLIWSKWDYLKLVAQMSMLGI